MTTIQTLASFLFVLTMNNGLSSGAPAYPLDGRNPHFYPYGNVDGTEDIVADLYDDDTTGEIAMSGSITFFDTEYNSIYVSR